MKKGSYFGRPAMGAAVMIAILVGVSSGCVATRRFTRTRVNEKAQELSARIDTNEHGIQTHTSEIQANTSQIQELGSVTRDHTQKISTLDGGLKQTDEKTQRALAVGEGAQGTADKAVGQVSALGQKFENRNNYTVLSEEKVKFKFNSATIEKSYLPALDTLAQQVKEKPDAILVMEGRTDSTGPDSYNIQLGEKRLEAVIRYLVVEQGVPMHKVYRMSYGKDQPLSENKTRDGRAENRSVVMRIMGPNLSAEGGKMVSATTKPE